MTKVDYVLTGCANGHPVRIVDHGGSVARGQLRFEFTAAEPALLFDASFARLVGLDTVRALVAGLVVAHDDPVVARCRVDVLTEGGAEVGSIVATVAVTRRRGGYRCECQLAEAAIAVEPGERLVSVEESEVRAQGVLGGVALFTAMKVETSRGHEWVAMSTTFLPGCDVGSPPAERT